MTAVTDEPDPRASLPLHHRQVWKTVPYFYCSKCGTEQQFTWTGTNCTETGELLCRLCSYRLSQGNGHNWWRVCRRCRQPRRAGSQFNLVYPPCSNTICDECRSDSHHQPLQLVCAHCRNPFTAKRSDARFCSGRCRTAAHRRTPTNPMISCHDPNCVTA
jgi:hypothetical protein